MTEDKNEQFRTALETGVSNLLDIWLNAPVSFLTNKIMKRTGYLIEKIQELDNLYLAYFKAKRGKSGTRAAIDYSRCPDYNIKTLQEQIQTGNISIGNYHYFTIRDPKVRLICAVDFPERVLHHAIMNICHAYFEQYHRKFIVK
jgi:hypothetical protein